MYKAQFTTTYRIAYTLNFVSTYVIYWILSKRDNLHNFLENFKRLNIWKIFQMPLIKTQ